MLADVFRGHGVFIYEAAKTIAKYGSPQQVVEALKTAGMRYMPGFGSMVTQ